MKTGRALAKILKLEGVEFLSCFPHNPLVDPVAEEGIRPILARTERVVVNIADGFSRVTNGQRIGVCAMQFQAGIENACGGVAQAYGDSVPILVLPGHAGRKHLGILPDFDAVQNLACITKWAGRINLAERAPELMRRAFTQLRSGRPGPVLLEVPHDVAQEDFPEPELRYSPPKPMKTAGDPQDIREAVRMLLAAKRPLLWAGQGVLYARAWDELREFAELLQLPVMTTLGGKSAFPENHPLALGAGGNSTTKAVDHFLREADLIFAIGSSLRVWFMGPPIPDGKVIIQCTLDERDINKDYAVNHAVMGDAALVLRQLIQEAKSQAGPEGRKGSSSVAEEVRGIKKVWLEEWMPKLRSDEVPINPFRVVWELMQSLDPAQTIITHDSGNPRDQLAPFYEATTPRGYLGWGHSSQLGYSLGLALGAKLAAPEKLVVNVLGDAGFGMCGMDFETAVREKIPILTVLMNNSEMGGYEKHIPFAAEHYRLKYITGDYSKIAEGLGGYAEKVEHPDGIAGALERAKKIVEGGKPALLEIITRAEREIPFYW